MLGSTRRSGYPSDSSRRRRSQQVDGLTVAPTPANRRPHLPGPGTGQAAPPGRCHQWVTQTGACAPPTTANPPPSPARVGDLPCHPARTVPIAGDSDWSPSAAGDGDPTALIGPGRGQAMPPRPGVAPTKVGAPLSGLGSGPAGHDPCPSGATPQPSPAGAGQRFPPTSMGGGRRVKVTLSPTLCTRRPATPTPRVYNLTFSWV